MKKRKMWKLTQTWNGLAEVFKTMKHGIVVGTKVKIK